MLVLFDLDGTLLSTRGAGMEAVLEACRAVCGFEFRHALTRVDGNLDPVIWRALCAENGIEPDEAMHARFRAEYGSRLERKLAEPGRARRHRGTLELVEALRGSTGATLGVLTGNYPETGRAKLAAAGFDCEHFEVAAWGSDAGSRPELVPVALERHFRRRGVELAPDRVIVVGDTPFDVECAKANRARSLGVATGRFDVASLEQAGADLAVADLADTRALLRWMAEPYTR